MKAPSYLRSQVLYYRIYWFVILFYCMHTQEEGTTVGEGLQMTVERVGNIFSTALDTSGNESIQFTIMGSNVCKLFK